MLPSRFNSHAPSPAAAVEDGSASDDAYCDKPLMLDLEDTSLASAGRHAISSLMLSQLSISWLMPRHSVSNSSTAPPPARQSPLPPKSRLRSEAVLSNEASRMSRRTSRA